MTKATPLPFVDLGAMVTSARVAAGLEKQADAAARLGVSQQTVSRWEAGTHRPRAGQISEIAEVLHINAADLMSAAGYTNSTQPVRVYEPLPVDLLDPESFEHFTADLLHFLHPTATVRRLGEQGHDQGGLDIEMRDQTGVTGFQCKRAQQFGPKDVARMVDHVSRPVDRAVLVLSRVASPQTADAVREYPKWDLWDKDHLSRLVRTELPVEKQVRLVDIYFKGRRRALLGLDETGPWMTADEFFRPFSGNDKALSHDWSLIARDEEIDELLAFARSADRALIVSAAGGMGKSKLLRDAARRFATENPAITVRFLTASGEPNRVSLEQLGSGPRLLVVDDAHDRDNLGELLQYATDPANLTQVILASRPYALNRIRNQAAVVGLVAIKQIDLPELSQPQLEALAAEALPSAWQGEDFAKRLVQFAGQSPLVVAMAARVISSDTLSLERIKDHEVFKDTVLRRFARVTVGDLGVAGEEKAHKAVLEALALTQPFHIEDNQLLQFISELQGLTTDEISRVYRRFVEGGIVFKRGPFYRLMPDVLADYLLDDVCIGPTGKLSPFVHQALDKMPPKYLSNALVNLGRLDWRRHDGDTENSELLKDIWQSFDEITEDWNPRLDAIKAVAIFQPRQTLDFVRRQMRRRRTMRALPEILRNVVYSGAAIDEALGLLWQLGLNDNRATNANTSHPIRVITDLAEYGVRKPLWLNEAVLKFALALCDNPPGWTGVHTPFDLLKPLMSAEGTQWNTTRETFSVSPFLISHEIVASFRRQIVDKMLELMGSTNVRIAYAAADFLEVATRGPHGLMGLSSPGEHRAAFTEEFKDTLARVRKRVDEGMLPIARQEIDLRLAWYQKRRDPDLAKIASEIHKAINRDVEFVICDAVRGNAYERFLDQDVDDYEKRARKWALNNASKITEAYPDVSQRLMAIERVMADFKTTRAESNPHLVLDQFCRNDEEFASAMCELPLMDPERPLASWANLSLGVLLRTNPDLARSWVARYLDAKGNLALRVIAVAFRYLDTVLEPPEIDAVKALLVSPDRDVATEATYTVSTWRDMPIATKLDLLLQANIGDDSKAADNIALALIGPERDRELSALPEAQVAQLLQKLVTVTTLEGHWIDQLLAHLSKRLPALTLRFFMARIDHAGTSPEGSFRVANYGPWRHEPLQFAQSAEFDELSREFWTWMRGQADDKDFAYRAADAFEAMFGHENAAVARFFSAYLDSADTNELRLMAVLLRQGRHDFIFDQVAFVERFLERCQTIDAKLYDTALSYLMGAATSGMRSGRIGEPMPRDVADLKQSMQILTGLSPFSPAYELYEYVRNRAQEAVDRPRVSRDDWEDD
ncbi:helix-turn-helix domain-containing protein [Asticcacaulis sp. W401b]|uniref:helix-turn-helix domain-containing protein n=1 Tax=Asticcacaulis sp. W401b TaxID=3388666 RepID=UPI0039705739